jgi:hypothetical protein
MFGLFKSRAARIKELEAELDARRTETTEWRNECSHAMSRVGPELLGLTTHLGPDVLRKLATLLVASEISVATAQAKHNKLRDELFKVLNAD